MREGYGGIYKALLPIIVGGVLLAYVHVSNMNREDAKDKERERIAVETREAREMSGLDSFLGIERVFGGE